MVSAFEGMTVLELVSSPAGAVVGQFFADNGADVIMVEPPGGAPLREQVAFPFWARGKRSVALDLKDAGDRAHAVEIAGRADVLVESYSPGVSKRLGVDYDTIKSVNPSLVYVTISGFGERGPYAGAKGYEAIVQAKVGAFAQAAGMAGRAGPSFVNVPSCTSSAAQLAIHAALAALIERLRSNTGQRVETTLAQALGAHDTWNGMVAHVARQYPEAFQNIPPVDDDGVPTSGLMFRLITGMTSDGRWLQFSQTAPRLFRALMRAVDLEWMFSDPEWHEVPDFDDAEHRRQFWELLLERIQSRSLAEWNSVFEGDEDVWAEVFRHGDEVLDHPQFGYDGDAVEVNDPQRGPVRQPAQLVRVGGGPKPALRIAPPLDDYRPDGAVKAVTGRAESPAGEAITGPPLQGLVVLELGAQYAAPFGATLLTDLGARVIKLEPLEGDQIRYMTSFPDLSGVKVMQGKESLAIDITSTEGLEIVYQLVERADVVLQSFRAGVAERRGLSAAHLQARNPRLVYVSAPAYGEAGPCGRRPAYAPTIGAACGIPWRNVSRIVPEGTGLSVEDIKAASMQLRAGSMGAAHADGYSALGVGTGLLFGIYLRERGLGAQHLGTSMLLTTAHAMADDIVQYPGRPATTLADRDLYGLNARYRLYPAAAGWVMLAVPAEAEWVKLIHAEQFSALKANPRYASKQARADHDEDLAADLAKIFQERTAEEWEAILLPQGVPCVQVTDTVSHEHMYSEEFGRASGYVIDVDHPTFGPHPRLTPLVRFSRSETRTGRGCTLGEHTDAILSELGHSAQQIETLRAKDVVA